LAAQLAKQVAARLAAQLFPQLSGTSCRTEVSVRVLTEKEILIAQMFISHRKRGEERKMSVEKMRSKWTGSDRENAPHRVRFRAFSQRTKRRT